MKIRRTAEHTSSERSREEIMAVLRPRYSKEEFARRGDEIYRSGVRRPKRSALGLRKAL
jgi:hypothetical protein